MGDWDFGDITDALDEVDLSSLWSPSNLRSEPNWQFTMPDFNFSDINLGNLDLSTIADAVDNVDFGDIVDTANIDLPSILSSSDRQGILNQINPYVQTYLRDPNLGFPSMSSPVGMGVTGGGYFSDIPSDYYGLSSPKLSDTIRNKLYEGINFATEGGVRMFARRLASASQDTVSLRAPDGGTITAKPDGTTTKTAASSETPHANAAEKGQTQGQGGGQGGGAAAGGGGGMSPLVAMGLLGGLASMLTTDGSGARQHAPIRTVRDIPPSSSGLNIYGRGEVPYGQAGAPVTLDPNLARNLGAPMRVGGLAPSVNPAVLAHGGRTDYSHGAPVSGEGSGQDDKIPALLSDGEYVIDADTVAALGDGSNKEGARLLDEFRQVIRAHKRSAPDHKIPPKAKSPLQYLKEAKHD